MKSRTRKHGLSPVFEPFEPRLLLDTGSVLINEIMYHPGTGDPGYPGYVAEDTRLEYIELYNKGAAAVSLKDWKFTQGIAFTFPDLSIGAGQYLVVAADTTAFHTKYPSVDMAKVVGGWTGKLANSGQDVELEDPLGQRMDFVSYTNEGDWAQRRVGDPYPGQPSWWRGWQWSTGADAGGKSLELINPAVSNTYGQNWAASTTDGGTPGAPNIGVAAADIAPVILDVRQTPIVPKSTDPVTITAHIVDELPNVQSVTLRWRIDANPPPTSFASMPMFDDGLHGDGLAGDGVYGAILPAQANKTIIDFYVQATDNGSKVRTWPAPTDSSGTQGANALYQVDDTVYAGDQPMYKLVIPAKEWADWLNLMNNVTNGRYSDATMNATFIALDGTTPEIRYTSGVRNRGAGTRASNPHNLQVNIPHDHPLNGRTRLEFNTQYVQNQAVGDAILSLAGIPTHYGAAVQVRVNGANQAGSGSPQFGSYYRFEPYGPEWADEHLPEDPQANIYKGTWYLDYAGLGAGANLRYINDDPVSYRQVYSPTGPTGSSGAYSKQTNGAEDDWTDLINLVKTLNNTPDAQYAQAVSQVVNVDEWMGYFAFTSLAGNGETTLGTGYGDDYSMFCGVADPRFQILSHDLDTILGQGASVDLARLIWYATSIPALNRFMKFPDFAPRYYAALKNLADTVFSAGELNPLLDQVLGGWVNPATIQSMKDYAATRRTNVLAQIPLSLSITSPEIVQSGYPRTANATTSLTGKADAINTRSVKVNGVAAAWTPWSASWSAAGIALNPGINRIVVQAFDSSGNEIDRSSIDVWYDKAGAGTTVTDTTVSVDTVWSPASGPYTVAGSLAIAAGATLTIQPGTTVYLGSGANLTVNSGGRLLAEGTDTQRIMITRAPASASSWGGIDVNGAVGTPETRISYAHIVYNGTTAIHSSGGTVFLDHLTFGTTTHQYLSLDSSSFVVQDCEIPAPTSGFESVHGSGGIKAGGRGLFLRNFFGATNGYNDVIDFTGGNRPGQPIVQFIDNVFAGASDDMLDLDGTDAWIEGNIFMHVHKNGPPDTSSAVSGGSDSGNTSEVTVIGNLFYDVDHAAMAKQGDFFTLVNNTIVRQTHQGGLDTDGAVICVQDNGMTEALGMYLEGNIVYDAEKLVRDQVASVVTFNNNLVSLPWTGPGSGNTLGDPLFQHVPQMSETVFANWKQAQVMWDWLGLRPGSPAVGAGPNGTDKGGVNPLGASIAGVPDGVTNHTTATLTVGPNLIGYGIPTAGWPNGSGFTHYKWRLDGEAWSAETPIGTPIVLAGLANGPHTVDVVGKNDAGLYQNDPALGPTAVITHSRTWTVDTSLVDAPRAIINEVLANNLTAVNHAATFPDMIELYNDGQGAISLADWSLTDNDTLPRKYVFPAGTSIPQGGYLVVYADDPNATPGTHVGFGLKADGDDLYLYKSLALGGGLADSVVFGVQLPDRSIARRADGSWGLATPTFGGLSSGVNVGAANNSFLLMGDPKNLRINEWLTSETVVRGSDFVELYNGDPLPVDMGGLYLTDNPVALPYNANLHQANPAMPAPYVIPPLSFIDGGVVQAGLKIGAYTVFTADGDTTAGADHTDFALSPFQGMIGLFDQNLGKIDTVWFGPQKRDVSQGRLPLASQVYAFGAIPTPGIENPGVIYGSTGSTTTTSLITSMTQSWKYLASATDPALGTAWYQYSYPAGDAWLSGAGLLYLEGNGNVTPRNTLLPGVTSTKPYSTYYFRTHFTFAGTPNDVTSLTLKTQVDDGAVLYLNGVDLYRVRMAAGTVTYTTLTENGAQPPTGDATTVETWTVTMTPALKAALKNGDNVLSSEVHQCATSSTDIVWGCTLDANITTGGSIIVREVDIPANITALMNNLRVTEVMYNPPGGNGYEYIELKNTSTTTTLDLTGVRLTDAVDFTFPSKTLAPGQYVLVVADLLKFQSRYGAGLNVAGQFTGKLSDNGELVVVKLPEPYSTALTRFDYRPDWFPSTNGGGRSLVIINPTAAASTWDSRWSWRASLGPAGSPGADEPTVPQGTIVLNELRTHSDEDPPLGLGDWIELKNTTADAVNIGGWYLSDDAADLTKYRIADNTIVQAGDYHVLNERDHFGDFFALSELGETLYLSSCLPGGGLGSYREILTFDAAEREVTLGRYTNSRGLTEFVPLDHSTMGYLNAAPMIGPVVINEVNYHPLVGGDAFIELQNVSGAAVLLYDPVHPENTWQITDGVQYAFPTETVLPAGGTALVVALDPAEYRAKYGIPAAVQVFGSYTGSLNNSGELIALRKPGDPEPPPDNTVPYYLVDHVAYGNSFPWPTSPDGHGTSLERVEAGLYGNDPANWMAGQGGGTPGAENSVTPPHILAVAVNGRADRGLSAVDPSAAGLTTLRITLNHPVSFAASDILVQKVEFNGTSETVTGTLVPAVSMAGNVMTLTLPAAVTDSWVKVTLKDSGTFVNPMGGNRLDGDPRPGGGGRSYLFDASLDLPSGNRLAGGSAVFYVGSLRGDFSGGPGGTQDGVVTEADIDGFLAKFALGDLDADFRGVGFADTVPDGRITPSDFDGLISAYEMAVVDGRHLDPLPNPGPLGSSDPEPLAAGEPLVVSEPAAAGEPLAAGEPEAVVAVLGGYLHHFAPGESPGAKYCAGLPAAVAPTGVLLQAVIGEEPLDLACISAADVPPASATPGALTVAGAETGVPLASTVSDNSAAQDDPALAPDGGVLGVSPLLSLEVPLGV